MTTSDRPGCDGIRVALSARLDGEDTGVPAARLDAHLARCPGCRAWRDAAQRITRTVRVQPIAVPDLVAPILAAVAADESRAAGHARDLARSRYRILRLALGLTAAVQLLTALPALLAGVGVAAVDAHLSREAASLDIALAVGFALAAWRPDRARAFLPVAAVLSLCLGLTSVFDLAGGITMIAHEAGHLAAIAQVGLLWALSHSRVARSGGTPSAPATVSR